MTRLGAGISRSREEKTMFVPTFEPFDQLPVYPTLREDVTGSFSGDG